MSCTSFVLSSAPSSATFLAKKRCWKPILRVMCDLIIAVMLQGALSALQHTCCMSLTAVRLSSKTAYNLTIFERLAQCHKARGKLNSCAGKVSDEGVAEQPRYLPATAKNGWTLRSEMLDLISGRAGGCRTKPKEQVMKGLLDSRISRRSSRARMYMYTPNCACCCSCNY